MPYSIETKDGITLENIPDDIKPDSPQLQQRVADIRAKRDSAPEGTAVTTAAMPSPAEMTLGERLMMPLDEAGTTLHGLSGAITRGMAPVTLGAMGGAALGAPTVVGAVPGAIGGAAIMGGMQLFGDPAVKMVNSALGTNYNTPTEAIENLLTSIGVAKALTPTERVVQAGVGGLAGVAGSLSQAKTLEQLATTPQAKAVAEQLLAQPVQQLAGGAGAGLAGQTAAEAGAGPVGQIAASLAGGVAGAKAAGMKTEPRPVQLPSDLEAARRAGIDVLTTDVVPPRTFAAKWMQATGEKIPLAGTGGMRQEQQAQRVSAVQSLLRDAGVDEAAELPKQIMTDLVNKRSAALTKYTDLKGEVIDRLSGAGTVEVPNTVAAIDDQIGRLESLRTKEVQPVIDKLTDWKAAIQGQDLGNVELLRKQIGESFSAPELAAVRSTGEKALSNIYGALKQDMTDFIKANGERRDFDKWNIANKRLSNMSGELKNSSLKSILQRGEGTPELVEKMLFSTKPSEMRMLYSQLSPEGRSKAQVAILAKAADKAGGIENISPDKFANEVDRLGKSVGVFFSGDDLKRVQGLNRVLQLTKRAAQASVAPPTGVQVALPVGAAVLTDLFGSWGAATLSGATLGGLARAYESKPVRNLLIKLPQTAVGSREEAALIKRLAAVAQAQAQKPGEEKTQEQK